MKSLLLAATLGFRRRKTVGLFLHQLSYSLVKDVAVALCKAGHSEMVGHAALDVGTARLLPSGHLVDAVASGEQPQIVEQGELVADDAEEPREPARPHARGIHYIGVPMASEYLLGEVETGDVLIPLHRRHRAGDVYAVTGFHYSLVVFPMRRVIS